MDRSLLPPLKPEASVNLNAQKNWSEMESINPDDIEFPKGSADVLEVSFFPTPFARLYMVDHAFKKYNEKGASVLTKEEIRLINWTIDLLELVFFKEVYNIELQFVEAVNLGADNFFERARMLFWKYETPVIIRQKTADNTYRILGSLSPFSLVFPAYHRITDEIPMGVNRKLFDKNPAGINVVNRSVIFDQYLIDVSRSISLESAGNFRSFLRSFYPNRSANPDFAKTITAIRYTANNGQHAPLQAGDNNGHSFVLKALQQEAFVLTSPYRVQSNLGVTDTPIFISAGNVPGDGLVSNFTLKLPVDPQTLKNHSRRYLPGTIIRCNWISEDDLFYDEIVKLPYHIDTDCFITGIHEGIKTSVNDRYLFPLKDEYYKYYGFDGDGIHHLSQHYDIDEKYGLTARLTISVGEGKEISLKKEFSSAEKVIELHEWYVSIFPNFIVNHSNAGAELGPIDYFVHFYDNSGNPSYPIESQLSFYNQNPSDASRMTPAEKAVRLKKTATPQLDALVNYKMPVAPKMIGYALKLGSANKNIRGYLIPKYAPVTYKFNRNTDRAQQGCEIAIDFGTTSSAIAIKRKDQMQPEVFSFKNCKELRLIDASIPSADANFYTYITSQFHFNAEVYDNPLRSLIYVSKESLEFEPFTTLSIYLLKGHWKEEGPNKLIPEFKWLINNTSIQESAKPWVKNYIRALLLLVKYEMLASGEQIDFKHLSLKWFYPLAFGQEQKAIIRQIWPEASKQVFPEIDCDNVGIDESIAPFYDSQHAGAEMSIINIDIGGGTTDICLMYGDEQKLKLSLPFAARNIVGDLYAERSGQSGAKPLPQHENGIIRHAREKSLITPAFNTSGSHEAFISITGDKAKVSSVFRGRQIIVLFFYYAVLYYIKEVIDAFFQDDERKKMYPEKIRFSGNGSKIIAAVIQPEHKVLEVELRDGAHSLNSFTKAVFNTPKRVLIEFSAHPKTATVMGALQMPAQYKKLMQSCELFGENIDGIRYNQKLRELPVSYKNAPPISPDSYVLSTFLPAFLQFLTENVTVVNELAGREEITVMIAYLTRTIRENNITKIQEYIQGGLKSNGQLNQGIESSFLMYALQGIINEMTRENWHG